MKHIFSFTSPMVIRPGARQLKETVLFSIFYLILQGYTVVTSCIPLGTFQPFPFFYSLGMFFLTIWYLYCVKKKAEKNCTAFLMPMLLICSFQVLYKLILLVFSIFQHEKSFSTTLIHTVIESAFWLFLAFFIARAVCGRSKILIPMLFLFFGFFYLFTQVTIRDIYRLASCLFLFLILWLPLDAIVFTSLSDRDHPN